MTIPTQNMADRERCPSGFALDQLHLGELPDDDASEVQAHVGACGDCTEELAIRASGFAAFEGLDSAASEVRLMDALAGVAFPETLIVPSSVQADECPSVLTLEKGTLGELDPAAQGRVDTHLTHCTACQEQMHALSASTKVPYNEEAVTGALHRALAGHEMPETLRKAGMDSDVDGVSDAPGLIERILAFLRIRESFAPALAFGAMALVAVGVLSALDLSDKGVGQGLQVKGALALQVYRKAPAGSVELLSGSAITSDDRLRFALRAPQHAQVLVVGRDLRGFYPLYPATGRQSVPFKREGRLELPGAVQLDDQPGDEWFFAVACQRVFGLADIKDGGAPGTLTIPEGCRSDSFRMEKKPPEG
jgi:anti-sigma factor RsiW